MQHLFDAEKLFLLLLSSGEGFLAYPSSFHNL